jgi:hypothetical protein
MCRKESIPTEDSSASGAEQLAAERKEKKDASDMFYW